MDDPIVVWPPGTFFLTCEMIPGYFDCTEYFPEFSGGGYTVCCLAG